MKNILSLKRRGTFTLWQFERTITKYILFTFYTTNYSTQSTSTQKFTIKTQRATQAGVAERYR